MNLKCDILVSKFAFDVYRYVTAELDRAAKKAEKERKKKEKEKEPRWAQTKGAESDCHVLDYNDGHTCVSDGDCGVDAGSCVPRKCSDHRFCFNE